MRVIVIYRAKKDFYCIITAYNMPFNRTLGVGAVFCIGAHSIYHLLFRAPVNGALVGRQL